MIVDEIDIDNCNGPTNRAKGNAVGTLTPALWTAPLGQNTVHSYRTHTPQLSRQKHSF